MVNRDGEDGLVMTQGMQYVTPALMQATLAQPGGGVNIGMATRELSAAQAILTHPDRHTNADLAYAHQRAEDCSQQIFAYWREQWDAFAQSFYAALRPIGEALTVYFRALGQCFAQIGLVVPAAQGKKSERRRRLRDARRRARLSTQVPRHGGRR